MSRVRRGADVASNHHPVKAKLKLKLKGNLIDTTNKRI
jgi:hypothetical protein